MNRNTNVPVLFGAFPAIHDIENFFRYPDEVVDEQVVPYCNTHVVFRKASIGQRRVRNKKNSFLAMMLGSYFDMVTVRRQPYGMKFSLH